MTGGIFIRDWIANKAVLVNSGRIEVTQLGHMAYDGSTGDEVITNSGTIIGGVLLQGGHDFCNGAWGIQSLVNGNEGNDTLIGGVADDILAGEDGADTLEGGAGEDMLTSSDGDDRRSGGAGDDLLDGGAFGADVFVFARGMGHDPVMGAGPGFKLDLQAFHTTFGDVLAHSTRISSTPLSSGST